VLRFNVYRTVTDTMRRGVPGPQGSILKLLWSETDQEIKETAAALQGPHSQLVQGSPHAIDRGRWQHELLWSRAATIYAGTSEVQRNIIAQRVLGLPRG
jgi:alkylation response protein AidB-like acyl-CoA dehydrogenase